jgi:serine phosphatase RsbU (regulator of sigma subunit)
VYTSTNPRLVRPSRVPLGAFQLSGDSRAASGPSGGDFYAFELRDDNRMILVIGDACGHGNEGAKLLPSVLPGLEDLARSTSRPSQLLNELNQRLFAEMPSDRFVTSAVYEFDVDAGTVTIANAGHVPAILRDARGRVSVVGRASGPPLGLFRDCEYTDQRYRIGKHDVLVFMTDGMLEAVETADLAKMSTLIDLVAAAPTGSRGMQRFLLGQVDGPAAYRCADDVTLLSLEILRTRANPLSRPGVGQIA